MPEYRYRAINEHGDSKTGTLTADNEEQLEGILNQDGFYLLEAQRQGGQHSNPTIEKQSPATKRPGKDFSTIVGNETVLYALRPSWASFFWYWVACGFVSAGILFELVLVFLPKHLKDDLFTLGMTLLLLGIIVGFVILARFSKHYLVTPSRVISRKGLISRTVREVKFSTIRDVWVKQGPIQRSYNTGDVGFSSAGTGTTEVIFGDIKDPFGIKEKVRALYEGHKQKD